MLVDLVVGLAPTDYVLDPAGVVTITVSLNYAQRWSINLANIGAVDATAVTFAKSIDGTGFGPESATIGTINAGTSTDVAGINECLNSIRFTFTIAGITTFRVTDAGA